MCLMYTTDKTRDLILVGIISRASFNARQQIIVSRALISPARVINLILAQNRQLFYSLINLKIFKLDKSYLSPTMSDETR